MLVIADGLRKYIQNWTKRLDRAGKIKLVSSTNWSQIVLNKIHGGENFPIFETWQTSFDWASEENLPILLLLTL